MDIRDTETVKKYKQAKRIVEQYEKEYNIILHAISYSNDWDLIWDWRAEIVYRLQILKNSGLLDDKTHPYNLGITKRRGYIKKHLLKIYKNQPVESYE